MNSRLPAPESIIDVVQQVVATATALAVRPDLPPAFGPEQGLMAAVVRLHGAFEGSVALYCSTHFARRLTGALLTSAPDAVTQEAVRDALGELTQIIAGNVKSLMDLPAAEPCTLSTPEVSGTLVEPASAEYRRRLGFACGHERFGVVLWELGLSEPARG